MTPLDKPIVTLFARTGGIISGWQAQRVQVVDSALDALQHNIWQAQPLQMRIQQSQQDTTHTMSSSQVLFAVPRPEKGPTGAFFRTANYVICHFAQKLLGNAAWKVAIQV